LPESVAISWLVEWDDDDEIEEDTEQDDGVHFEAL